MLLNDDKKVNQMTLQLRDYQEKAINELYDWLSGNEGNPLIVLPTGAGKSLVIAKIIEDVLTNWPDQRVIVLTHVKELVSQNFKELLEVLPNAPAGVYSAGLNSRDTRSQILFCGIQSVYSKAYEIQRCNLILIDEAHLLSPNDDSRYQKFINDMRIINGNVPVIGLTATPYRLDSGKLFGEGALFSAIAHETSVLELIERGYLSRLISKATATKLDTSGVAVRGGDFAQGELEAAVDIDFVTQSAIKEVVEFGQDRIGWLLFAAGCQHALHIRDAVRAHGISCEMILGSTPKEERDRVIGRFKRREIQALTSVNVMTTGFNAKHVDLIALLRPTKSCGVYVQSVGRGTRLSPETDKKDCLILDFAGVVARFGPIDKIIIPEKKKRGEKGEAPTKVCPGCKEEVHASLRECPYCGFEFEMKPKNINATASELPILSNEKTKPQWIKVSEVNYKEHRKPGGRPTLRAEYRTGVSLHSEWICLEHDGYARTKAISWWLKRAPGKPAPETIGDALRRVSELKTPTEVLIRVNGKYTEIMNHKFD